MLDIKYIRENPQEVKENNKNRGVKVNIDRFLELDKKRAGLIKEVDTLRAEKNKFKGKPTVKDLKNLKEVKEKEEKLTKTLRKTVLEWKNIITQIPNLTHPDSPIGKNESKNKEIEKHGKPTKFDFKPKTHEELGRDLDLIDFERAAEVTGSKFYYLKNEGALLELALTQYAFEVITKHGFTPIITPDLARDEVSGGIGYIPRGPETQVYSIENTNLTLVGTSEITLGGYHMNEILPEEKLPIKYGGLSHCFRTEAGSYGKYSAGLYRIHQFSKVEMFIFSLPEESEKMHEQIKNIEVEIFKGLGIPIRVVDICTGDLGGPAYRKYDLEGWMPSRNDYGEVTSTSNTTDYQARALNVKIKRKDGRKEFVHMLNGTGIAISRALIVVFENYQQKDGSVKIPKVLQKYIGGIKEIRRQKDRKTDVGLSF